MLPRPSTATFLSSSRRFLLHRPSVLAVRPQSTQPRVKYDDPQIGDYPNLPWVNAQTRAPSGWFDNQDRRNFGETIDIHSNSYSTPQLHEEDEALGVWSPDLHSYSPYKALSQLAAMAVALTGFSFYVYHNQVERPATRTEPMAENS
ncbi:hypothetical protein BC938DRAFT_478488 [Jimgerdemannia flammicorona]|uniref:Uncharacterized protein n=1 Tax=Jimgerdemannia flammicorona TaxID=994334 RepID=A0A433QMV6_9FUNG|nr:hypothetical protein BC938DRAFT_478488 [Jimgerdemannia flammicorona]